jgi:peptide/nickel transport system substrate-binding protein
VTDKVRDAAEFSRREVLEKAGRLTLGGAMLAAGLRPSIAFAAGNAGATVVEASLADPTTFNPLVGQDFAAYVVSGLCFDGLLSVNAQGHPTPAVAQALPTVSNGGTKYVFKLRPNAKWSDGTPLTADDVVFTYDLMFSPKYKAFSSAYRGDLETHLASVRAIDTHTVEFVTKGVYAPFLVASCTLGLMPKHVLGSMSPKALNTASFNQGPTVSNGVFKFVTRQTGASITFAQNPYYWAGPSKLAGYVIKIVPTSVSIAQQLTTGEIDIGPVTADQFDTVKNSVNLITFPSLNVEVATFNLNSTSKASTIFADPKVRQALWWALDRPTIIKAAFFGKGAVFTNSVEPPGTWAHLAKTTPNYSYNPAMANKILDAAGWTKDSSGMRSKNGQQMAFTVQTIQSYITAIEAMAEQWKAIGANVSTQQETIGVIIDQLFTTRTFDMIFIADNLLSADPDLSAYFNSRNTVTGGLNSGGYKNPQMDKAMDAANATLDQAKRKQYLDEFQNIFAQDPPGIPMLDLVQAYGVSKKVSGAAFSTYNNFSPRPFMRNVTKS